MRLFQINAQLVPINMQLFQLNMDCDLINLQLFQINMDCDLINPQLSNRNPILGQRNPILGWRNWWFCSISPHRLLLNWHFPLWNPDFTFENGYWSLSNSDIAQRKPLIHLSKFIYHPSFWWFPAASHYAPALKQ